MPIERMTAKKVSIADIVNGSWIKREGMEPSFVATDYGERISRARVMGTVVGTFVSEDGNFASITLDDGTETIRAKTFKTSRPLDSLKQGDVVDIIGKIREYNGEIYIIPEVVARVDDPNMELLRRLEIIKNRGRTPAKDAKEDGKQKEGDDNSLRKEILAIIESEPEGIEYKVILERVKAPETKIESTLNEILAEGICYEPTPGKIKKI